MLKRLFKLVALCLIAALGWGIWQSYGPQPAPPDLAAAADRVDRILIEKSARRLTASRQGETVLEYNIALGFEPRGDKFQEGDGKTPEGLFKVNRRNEQSSYHLSLGLDYPHAEHKTLAAAAGVSPGGDIFIHGQPNTLGGVLILPGDWTAGCIAISDAEMDVLWELVELGTVVEIRP
ncbi:L,D-transpeptidase catalytic domain [Phaeobacter sp. CECT 5382]|uniref:L,D-transpeptidase family protein n=1 Tax=Rhodobacterales TaxID=204455 RepID=UPI0006D9CBCD|nr:L,D-transpeptidase family protein [Phaeobacter sp. CECT 5382]CUH86886.1 L,D-transpeptidase catalytic domain [Phaeobacter sp. CECT 5382]